MKYIIFISLISTTLIHGASLFPTPDPDALAPPIPNSENAPPLSPAAFRQDGWWESLAYALIRLRGGVRVRQVVSIKFDDDEEDKDTPPPVSGPRSLTGGRTLAAGPLLTQRSQIAPTPKPMLGDVGICSTLVEDPVKEMMVGHLYSNNRRVRLHSHILPKRIKCRHNQPTTGGGKCVVAAYPHGAWIRVPPAELRHFNQSYCKKIQESVDSQCWDYVAVPGYCVLSKPK